MNSKNVGWILTGLAGSLLAGTLAWAAPAPAPTMAATPAAVTTPAPATPAPAPTVAPVKEPAGGPSAAGAPVVFDQAAIKVGSEIITQLEIEEPLRQLRERAAQEFHGAELEAKMKAARAQHIERLIEDRLLLLEARDQKMEVPDAQVSERAKQEIESVRTQFGNEKDFAAQLAREHLTMEDLTTQREKLVREQFLRQKLLQGKLQEFQTGAEVSDAQLLTYYQSHPADFRQPARARVQQIFIARPDAGLAAAAFAKADGAARAKCEEAEIELKHGRDFGAVARKFSGHKASADKGGEVGWINKGDTGMPEFEQVVFVRLKLGETSRIISTARGFFIVKLEERQDGSTAPFEEVKGRIKQVLMNQGSESRFKAWIDTLKDKYKVVYLMKGIA